MGVEAAQRLNETELSYIVGSLYEAGSDTTAAVLEVFTLAALLHPDAVRTAQLELDSVIGQNRLPSFEDMSDIPYTTAFVKEVLRWRPVVTAGVPHLAEQDDEYMGYSIPKGSVVIANHWSLDLDENVFENANSFCPDRWIHNANLPISAFGFGRRVCVGKYLTIDSLNIIIARLLWAYDILPENSGNGIESVDPFRMKQIGLVSKPMPFRASFKVRSPSREFAIRSIEKCSQEATDKIMNRVKANVTSTEVV
jgi:cytochrome P450